MARKELPRTQTWLIRALRFLFTVFARHYFSLKVEGEKNIPENGPYIFVINHVTTLDIAFLGVLPIKGDVVFLAKREAFEEGLLRPFLNLIGAFPVDREAFDASAARTLLMSLKQGRIVGLAPEGTRTRTGEIQEFKPGFVKLALLARTPILPIAIVGSFGILPTPYRFPRRACIRMRVGKVIDLKEHYGRRLNENEIQQISEMVRGRIVELYDSPACSG